MKGRWEPTTVGVPQGSTDLAALQQHLPELAGPGVAQAGLPGETGAATLHRYADDAILICRKEAERMLFQAFEAISSRMGLTINREKTRITKLIEGFDFASGSSS